MLAMLASHGGICALGGLLREGHRGVVCEVGLTVVKPAVLHHDVAVAFEFHRILRFEGNLEAVHILDVVHTEATDAACADGPVDVTIGIAVGEKDGDFDRGVDVAVVDNDDRFVAFEDAVSGRGELTVRNDPVLFTDSVRSQVR